MTSKDDGSSAEFAADLPVQHVETKLVWSDICVEVDGAALSGSRWMPEGAPRSLVLMIPGSGPSTRNNDDFFAPIRARLLADGHAVASFDKRGAGDSTGSFSHSTISTQTTDAARCVEVLRAQAPEIPVGVFGHSQGGWVAYELAAQPLGLAFAISSSGPAVGPAAQERVRRLNLAHPSDRTNLTAVFDQLVAAARINATLDEVIAQIRAMPGHQDLLVELVALGADEWQLESSFMRYEPTHALERLATRTLVILGGNDKTIPVIESIKEFARIANPHVRPVVFDGADHRLKTGSGALVDDYLETLTGFINNLVQPAE